MPQRRSGISPQQNWSRRVLSWESRLFALFARRNPRGRPICCSPRFDCNIQRRPADPSVLLLRFWCLRLAQAAVWNLPEIFTQPTHPWISAYRPPATSSAALSIWTNRRPRWLTCHQAARFERAALRPPAWPRIAWSRCGPDARPPPGSLVPTSTSTAASSSSAGLSSLRTAQMASSGRFGPASRGRDADQTPGLRRAAAQPQS